MTTVKQSADVTTINTGEGRDLVFQFDELARFEIQDPELLTAIAAGALGSGQPMPAEPDPDNNGCFNVGCA